MRPLLHHRGALDRRNAGAHYGLGLVALPKGDLSKADRGFREAISLKVKFPEAQESPGKTLLRLHQWPAAAAASCRRWPRIPARSKRTNEIATALARSGQRVAPPSSFEGPRTHTAQPGFHR